VCDMLLHMLWNNKYVKNVALVIHNLPEIRYILPSYLFGQPGIFGQYDNDVIGEPMHVLIPSNFTLQYFKSQQIKENAKK